MSSAVRCRPAGLLAGLLALLPASLCAQPLPPPLPPSALTPQQLADCVSVYGNGGCAAHLYAQLLCEAVGENTPVRNLQQRLDERYAEAGIDFSGLTASQIERLALADHVPLLCPGKTPAIRDLFAPLAQPPAA
ncbi:MAG: hypothetical protein RLZZ124_1498 [Cyanobacteriota bacterium]|jgi:hypothetical protein